MAKPPRGQGTGRTRKAGQRWMQGHGAPDWFRRIWDAPIRTDPPAPKLDLNQLRRIAYL
jgi:hypothetical protein